MTVALAECPVCGDTAGVFIRTAAGLVCKAHR